MCGRFTQHFTWRELRDLLDLVGAARNLEPRYNIAPTSSIDVVMKRNDGLNLVAMRWGLIPGWWKKPRKDVPATFNARAETVAEKPMFRTAFKRTRCVIPASGFYEWEATEDGKQPWYMTAADGSVLLIAGLWERWTDVETGEDTLSAAMIVTAANRFMGEIHDRMPVLLDRAAAADWIEGRGGADLLKPSREDMLTRWRVSRRVNSARGESSSELIARI